MSKIISTFRSPDGQAQYIRAYNAVLRQWPVPYKELYISTCLGDTHIVASGPENGEPLILLHPAGGGATIWLRNVGPLSDHFRTYAVDTVGETNKSALTHPISIRNQQQQYANWMADLLDRLKVEKTNLIGNSFGGYLALNTAHFLPDRVKKVVLISPAATFVPIIAWALHFAPANAIGPLIGSKQMLLAPYTWIWAGFPRDEFISPLRDMCAIYGRPRHWSPAVFSDKDLRKIHIPILLLIGDHEVIYKPEDAIRRATRLVPNMKAEIIPKANHIAEFTAPEFVNSAIINFLCQEEIMLS